MRNPAVLLLCLLIAACAPRASVEVVRDAPGIGQVTPVFLGTTRLAEGPDRFSTTRRGALSFARYDISIPPAHVPGALELGGRDPDPALHFVTRGVATFDAAGFRSALRQEMRAYGTREVALFVHGFNNVLGDGLYRIAQMREDLGLPGLAAHYSWPSAGNPLGYVRDRDSALFARAGLIALLDEMAAAGVERIFVIAHSMGAFLAMEALVWAQARDAHPGVDRIAGVVLLSPDIDVDLFRAQAGQLDRLPQPFFVFTSGRDRALQLSARLTGETDRLGTLSDIARVADLELAVIDVTRLQDSASSHLAAVTSPTMLGLLREAQAVDAAFAADAGARTGLLPGTLLSVQNATALVVEPIEALGDAVDDAADALYGR
jgi:esterase/lipase superfamily enzyme